MEFHKVGLLEVRVQLNLVGGGDDGGLAEQSFQLGPGKVADAYGLALAALDELLHGLVRVDVVTVAGLDLAVLLRHEFVPPGKGARPVHEVQIEIIGLEVFEGCVARSLHVVWVVGIVP